MAKMSKVFSAKGILDLESGTLTEIKKDSETVVHFFDILKEFNLENVSVTIKLDNELGNEEDESDDE